MIKLSEGIKTIKRRALILGYPVDLINMQNALEFVEESINENKSVQVVTLNPEMIMYGNKNPDFGQILKQADLIVPDGIGIIAVLRKLGIDDVNQLPGIEFSQALIERCVQKGYRLGFLGASKEVVEIAVNNLKIKFPSLNVAFVHDGYFKEDDEFEIIRKLEDSNPQILFVALGVPRQEIWINKYKKMLNSAIMIGVGGSFDVWANKVKRAPVIFRKFGLEWFFRLISQPSRFGRMFPTLPLFFIKVWFDDRNTRKEC